MQREEFKLREVIFTGNNFRVIRARSSRDHSALTIQVKNESVSDEVREKAGAEFKGKGWTTVHTIKAIDTVDELIELLGEGKDEPCGLR